MEQEDKPNIEDLYKDLGRVQYDIAMYELLLKNLYHTKEQLLLAIQKHLQNNS